MLSGAEMTASAVKRLLPPTEPPRPDLHSGSAGQGLEIAVAHDRVTDLSQERDQCPHGVAPALGGTRRECRGVVVDEELHDRLGRANRLPPEIGRLANHLVRVLALGQSRDLHPRDLDAGLLRGQRPD
jgi:hypothetical protein